MEFISRNVFDQGTNTVLEQQAMGEQESTEQMEEGNTEELRNQADEEIPQPLAVIFPEEVEQEWEHQQANLDGFVEEAIKNENTLFNPTYLSEAQKP